MKCPSCGYKDSKVVDSRPTENSSIRRRRECERCQSRFTTYEIIDEVPVIVIKKDSRREIFDRSKVLSGLVKACYKRSVTIEQLEDVVSEIESEIHNSLKKEFLSSEIGVMVMDRLRKLDEVSYVRFASVYREFKDAETFIEELKVLQSEKQDKESQEIV
ncbi:MAG: transcriptional regulator NrdR [Oscillospiraceae bacterium]|nr:transcriptional regulator NrdR [Oscillospiraceae bacterium]